MRERIAVIDGVRTPMAKAGTVLKDSPADDLAAFVVREVLARAQIPAREIDEVVIGNVAQPANAANIARVIALKAGLPASVPAFTVHRNCASGMESITTAALKILSGYGKVFIAGGVESMSNIPLLFPKEYAEFAGRLSRSRTLGQRVSALAGFRVRMLKPEVALLEGLTDPVSGLIMGLTAENLSREFAIGREEQDELALLSHQRAAAAQRDGTLAQEILPVPALPSFDRMVSQDNGIRENQSREALAKLSPYFDRRNGTVTAGNSSQLTDGAAAVLLMAESDARARGLAPLGYLREFAYASLEPDRMGLGPVYATSILLDRAGAAMKDVDYVELNEAFAAQVIACERAFASDQFSRTFLGRSGKLGELDRERLNAQGGAIALGHPVGMTGTRLVIHALKELRRRKKNLGLATLCVGGGQGAALLLEAA
ncbi:MAG TPA: thiolase family protein [Spirochaetia bacterium]|nr:thiolase family protein [Spirochaetia bacterium]